MGREASLRGRLAEQPRRETLEEVGKREMVLGREDGERVPVWLMREDVKIELLKE